jgi:hypothetical protein
MENIRINASARKLLKEHGDKEYKAAMEMFKGVKPAPWARSKWAVAGNNVPEKKSKSQKRHAKHNTPGYSTHKVNKVEGAEGGYSSENEDDVYLGWNGGGPLQRLYASAARYHPEHTTHSEYFGKRLHGSNNPSETPGHVNQAWYKTERRERRLTKRAAKQKHSKKAPK